MDHHLDRTETQARKPAPRDRGAMFRLAAFALTASLCAADTSCSSSVAYSHRSASHIMTSEGAEYHKRVREDVQRNFGIVLEADHDHSLKRHKPLASDISPEEQLALAKKEADDLKSQEKNFVGACLGLDEAQRSAPFDGGEFPVRNLLENDKREVCKAAGAAQEEYRAAQDAADSLDRMISTARAEKHAAERKASIDLAREGIRLCRQQQKKQSEACQAALLTEAERTECAETCSEAAARDVDATFASSLERCLLTYSNLRAKSACTAPRPAESFVAPGEWAARVDACTSTCRRDGAETEKAFRHCGSPREARDGHVGVWKQVHGPSIAARHVHAMARSVLSQVRRSVVRPLLPFVRLQNRELRPRGQLRHGVTCARTTWSRRTDSLRPARLGSGGRLALVIPILATLTQACGERNSCHPRHAFRTDDIGGYTAVAALHATAQDLEDLA